MLGGMLRALTGGRSEKDLEEKKAAKEAAAAKKAEEKAAKEAEKAAREAEKQAAKEAEAAAAQAAAEAAAREAEAAAAAAAAQDAELTAAAAAAAAAIAASQGRGSPSPVHSFTSTDMPSPVLVTPPGGGAPIPMLPLAVPPADVQASGGCCARACAPDCSCPLQASTSPRLLTSPILLSVRRTPTWPSSWACRRVWLQP